MPLVKIFASTPARITAVARAVAAVHPSWAELWAVEPHILQIVVSTPAILACFRSGLGAPRRQHTGPVQFTPFIAHFVSTSLVEEFPE